MANRIMPKKTLSAFIALSLIGFAPAAMAGFTGTLELKPSGCQAAGHCTLGADFGFVDSKGRGWQAAKGLLTDGASIPPWAQKIVGEPFEESYIKAAVIHDHYCNRRVRSWRETHRVFYEGLLASGVSKSKAGIMYYAVLIGGPKWVKLIKGKPCPVGMGCINSLQIGASMSDGAFGLDETGTLLMSREQRYDSAQFTNMLESKMPELEALGDNLTPEQVEELAGKNMEADFYFKNGDEVGTTIGLNIQPTALQGHQKARRCPRSCAAPGR